MKINTTILFCPIVLIGAFLLLVTSCKKDDENTTSPLPILTTTLPIEDSITSTSAISGGEITSDQGSAITARGVCWVLITKNTMMPTIANSKTIDGAGMGVFVSNITNLMADTAYYVRAYATNASGTGYGELRGFLTTKGTPTITTSIVTHIGANSALSGGKITYNGGDSITASGIYWSTTETFTKTDSLVTDSIYEGSFAKKMANLTANTVYYAKAYATNSIGTGYGNIISFRTQQGGDSIAFTTVTIPAGTFTMGSPAGEVERNGDENQFQVTLSAFKISKYEITNFQFADFLNKKSIGSDGLYPAGSYPSQPLVYESSETYNWGLTYTEGKWGSTAAFQNNPVIKVTWFGAAEYAKFAGCRLPTEAEWEYACRGNTTSPFNMGEGNCIGHLEANYNYALPYGSCINSNTTKPGTTQTVGTYIENTFGLLNMHGNVREWCNDWYGAYPTSPQTNPTGAETGTARVIRGGSWDSRASLCRSAQRGYFKPEGHDYSVGFRVVIVP